MSKTLDRVSKLLALAERSTNEGERELAMARAQELASAAQIDLAVARAHQAKKERQEEPEKRRYQTGHYVYRGMGMGPSNASKWLTELFSEIARCNDVRCTYSQDRVWVFGHGFPSDLDVVEALYKVLSVQMVADADASLKRGDHKGKHRRLDGTIETYSLVDGRLWRANFYQGWIARVTGRLWEARQTAMKERGVDLRDENSTTALAVRNRQGEVHDFYKEQTKTVRGTYAEPAPAEHDYRAQHRGSEAGARARLDMSKDLGLAERPALH